MHWHHISPVHIELCYFHCCLMCVLNSELLVNLVVILAAYLYCFLDNHLLQSNQNSILISLFCIWALSSSINVPCNTSFPVSIKDLHGRVAVQSSISAQNFCWAYSYRWWDKSEYFEVKVVIVGRKWWLGNEMTFKSLVIHLKMPTSFLHHRKRD